MDVVQEDTVRTRLSKLQAANPGRPVDPEMVTCMALLANDVHAMKGTMGRVSWFVLGLIATVLGLAVMVGVYRERVDTLVVTTERLDRRVEALTAEVRRQ